MSESIESNATHDTQASAGPADRPQPSWFHAHAAMIGLWAGLAGCVMGGTALGLYLFANPLGHPLRSYSFDTPRAALLSSARIGRGGDADGLLDIYGLVKMFRQTDDAKDALEYARTVRVKHEARFNESVLLFVSFKAKGEQRFDVVVMQKKDGLWQPLGSYRGEDVLGELQAANPELAVSVRKWKSTGQR